MPPKTSEISALDLRFLAGEWEYLTGAFIRKVYQSSFGKGWKLVFEVFAPQKGTHYLHVFPAYITLNKQKGTVQENPSGFCMFLRKHLSGKKIEQIRQHGFDRILEISAGGVTLVLEFVPPGNVIVVSPDGVILAALNTKKWRDREVRVRSAYRYPPERPDPFSMDFEGFRKHFQQMKKTAAILAADLGFGSGYANKICSEAGVRPDKNAQSLKESELKGIFQKMSSVGKIERPEVFIEVTDKDKEKIQRIKKQREEALEKWKSAEKSAREKADAIYRKFDTVEAVLEKFSSKKESGFEPIERKEGLHITVNLDGVDVQLDLKKTAQENAALYYEQAKKAKRKIAGLEASMAKPFGMNIPEKSDDYPDAEAHKNWYEKFKWFRSSDGVLVVAGRNAEQNEILLKSHAGPDEWCFHADIRGAAFTIIKSEKTDPPEQTKKEAAEFAAAQSKAWTMGHGSVSAFSVLRKNLSKSPPTGMSLPKGSFMVYGQRIWYRNIPLRMAVGASDKGDILSGPESAVRKACPYLVILVPGRKKASDLSREMKSELMRISKPRDLPAVQKLSLDELARQVPFGFGEIAKN
jgi:predicted ribosome quality control (RQC) complex YloA/Tae2 family protein